MAYDYRKLTPQEREEVLRQRKERGYPLHSPPHPFRDSARYFLTAVNYEHVLTLQRKVGTLPHIFWG